MKPKLHLRWLIPGMGKEIQKIRLESSQQLADHVKRTQNTAGGESHG